MTPSEFQGYFPLGDFDGVGTDIVQKYLDNAAPHFNVARWMAAGFYSEGLAKFVAHNIAVDTARKAKGLIVDGGNVTEKHVGPVGMSMDSALIGKQAEDPFLLTSYGREYAALRDRVGLGGAVGR